MMYILLSVYCLLFTWLAWRNFNFALAFLFFCLPTYLIRFHIGPLPTTLLEVMIGVITTVWIIKYHNTIYYQLSTIIRRYPSLFISISLFILAATISIFTSINLRAALGEFKAFYVEPIILFLILITTFQSSYKLQVTSYKKNQTIDVIIFALTLCGLFTSLLAIYQHFTGWLVPYDFWQNENTFRVTAWYGFPNAVGLFLAPIIPLTAYLLFRAKKTFTNRTILFTVYCLLFTSLLTHILAIIFAKSTGALTGIVAGCLFFLFFYNKKTRWLAIAVSLVGLVGLVGLPQSNPIKQELLFQDRSGQLRVNVWAETAEFLKAHPITGAGLASYSQLIKPYRIDKWIEVFHHPHNLFLTMWVNLGLLGLVAFTWIMVIFFKIGYLQIQNSKFKIQNLFITTSMVIILVMGLVDSPYIKNDLSILFWLLPALLLNFLPLVGGGQEGVSQSQSYEQLENHKT